MASHPPGKCCLEGVKHEGEASGTFDKLGSADAYFAYPQDKSTSKAVLIIPDVMGMVALNAQLIADQMAQNGYFTVLIDPFRSDPLAPSEQRPADFDFQGWRAKHTPEIIDPIIEAAIKELKEKYGAKQIGTMGYCFGAKYVIRFLKKGVTDAGYVAHPSFISDDEVKAVDGPLSIAAAETDNIFPADKRHQTEAILQEIKVPYQLNLYSHVSHGFAVRGDLKVREIKYAKEQAFLQAVMWFNEYLKE